MTYSWGEDMAEFIDSQGNTRTRIIEFSRKESVYEQGFDVPDIRVIITEKI